MMSFQSIVKKLEEKYSLDEELSGQLQLELGKNRLSQALLDKQSVQYILSVAEEVLGNPILVFDYRFVPLAFSPSANAEIQDDAVQAFLNKEELELAAEEGFQSMSKLLPQQEEPFLHTIPGDRKCFRRMSFRICDDKGLIGHLTVLEANRKFDDMDNQLIIFLSQILSVPMKKWLFSPQHRVFSKILHEVKNCEITTQKEFRSRVMAWEWELEKNFYVFQVCISSNRYDTRYKLMHQYNMYIRILLEEYVFPWKSHFKLMEEESRFIWLVNLPDSVGMKEIEPALERYLMDCGLKGSLSRRFDDIFQFGSYCEQAERLGVIGEEKQPGQCFYKYEDFYFDLVLDRLNREHGAMAFCLPQVVELKQYDQDNDTDLLETLYVFLGCQHDVLKASRKLFIHRNTMARRLEKIQGILGMDLEEGDGAQKLFLSILIAREMPSN